MQDIKKVVFKEEDRTKAVFGQVKDLDDGFIQVTTTKGSIFTINKSCIVFIKEGGYHD